MNHVQDEYASRVPYTLGDVVDTLELARLERGRDILASRARFPYRAKLVLLVMTTSVPIAGFVCWVAGNSLTAIWVALGASVPVGLGIFLLMGVFARWLVRQHDARIVEVRARLSHIYSWQSPVPTPEAAPPASLRT